MQRPCHVKKPISCNSNPTNLAVITAVAGGKSSPLEGEGLMFAGGLSSHSVSWQGLCHGEPERESLHCERALAILYPVVCWRPVGHVRQFPRPSQGAFSHLADGKHDAWEAAVNPWKEGVRWRGAEVAIDHWNYRASGFLQEGLVGFDVLLGLRVFTLCMSEVLMDQCSSCTILSFTWPCLSPYRVWEPWRLCCMPHLTHMTFLFSSDGKIPFQRC